MAICPNCSTQNPDGTKFCTVCGTQLNQGAPQYTQAPPQYNQNPYYGQPPVAQLKTDRSWLMMWLLGLVTIGIYPLIEYCGIVDEVNTVCTRYDNKNTMNPILAGLLGCVTLCIYPLVWYHCLCDRMGNELRRRNIPINFDASTFWIYCFLLGFTIVCPILFMVKFVEASNEFNKHFNQFC